MGDDHQIPAYPVQHIRPILLSERAENRVSRLIPMRLLAQQIGGHPALFLVVGFLEDAAIVVVVVVQNRGIQPRHCDRWIALFQPPDEHILQGSSLFQVGKLKLSLPLIR